MKTGRCPKCSSNDVRSDANVPWKQSVYSSNTIPIPRWSSVALDNYVCGSCGYVESYVGRAEGLRKIREIWPKASEQRHVKT